MLLSRERDIKNSKDAFLEQRNFIADLSEVEELSLRYGIPSQDITLTALNLSGIKSSDITDNRIRFKFYPKSLPHPLFLAICVNTRKTPFELKGRQIYFAGEEIGSISELEEDTCDCSYFRRNDTSLTLNSNARSTCRGCTMCGTYSQEEDDLFTLLDERRLTSHLRDIFGEHGLPDASGLIQTTICTGCFGEEQEAVDHILLVHRVLKEFGFNS